MKKNMAILDRFLRLVIGVVLIILLITPGFATPWNFLVIVLAVLFMLTAITGICPTYTLLHIDTRQFKESNAPYKHKRA